MRRLAEEATARAERSLAQERIAGTVARASSPDTVTAPVLLTGTVRLPVSLPPGVRGLRAALRRGSFATADVAVRRPDGTLLAREHATLRWDEVRWTRGGRVRWARPVGAVLEDAVRKVVDRAVTRLKRHELRVSAAH